MRSSSNQTVANPFGVLLCALLTFCLQAAPVVAKDDYADEVRAIESYIVSMMEAYDVPGVSVAIWKDGFYWEKGFGFSDIENGVPSKPETAYRLASITKTMTALAVVKLAAEGKLDLDADVRRYVPYFPQKKWPVPVRMVLGHLGGISHYRDYEIEGSFTEHYDTHRSIAVFSDWDLVAEPGAKYNYSSYGYNLLGAVIEGATGRPYGEYMREQIWGPLGMDSTLMDDPCEIIPNRPRGYQKVNGEVKNSPFVDISSRFSAGGTRSTVSDLIRWARGVVGGGVVPAEALEEALRPMATSDGRYTWYGMGWGTRAESGSWVISHSGGQPETSTYLIIAPRNNFAAAFATSLQGFSWGHGVEAVTAIMLEGCPLGAASISAANEATYTALEQSWNHGMAHHNRYGEPLSEDEGELSEAFAYLNGLAATEDQAADLPALRKRIDEGVHPVAGEALTRVGSYVATRLAEKNGLASLAYYRRRGAIPFFQDYILHYKIDPTVPAAHRLSPAMESAVARWASDWEKTWNDEVRGFALRSDGNLAGVAERLKELFEGASIYPDFSNRLAAYARLLGDGGRIDEGLQVLLTASGIYPNDADLLEAIGSLYAKAEDDDSSRAFFELALEKDPESMRARLGLIGLDEVELDDAAMAAVEGYYELDSGLRFAVFAQEGALFVKPEGEGRAVMVPHSPNRFYSSDRENIYEITFALDAGTVTVKVGGQVISGRRVSR